MKAVISPKRIYIYAEGNREEFFFDFFAILFCSVCVVEINSNHLFGNVSMTRFIGYTDGI